MTVPNLYRIAGVAGVATGVLIAFNVARRAELIPTTTATHAVSIFASVLALPVLTALYLRQRDRVGTFGLVAYAVNFLGLAGVFAIEFATHTIFPYLDRATIDDLLAGGTKGYFLAVALVLLAGVLLFGAASWRAGVYPTGAVALYVAGLIPGALRTAVPDAVYEMGLLVAAVGVVWLAVSLWRSAVDLAVPVTV